MTTVAPTPKIEAEPTFTAVDRCDSCGAQAYASALVPGHQNALLWCRHHYLKHQPKLAALGAEFVDEVWRLESRPKTDQVISAFS